MGLPLPENMPSTRSATFNQASGIPRDPCADVAELVDALVSGTD